MSSQKKSPIYDRKKGLKHFDGNVKPCIDSRSDRRDVKDKVAGPSKNTAKSYDRSKKTRGVTPRSRVPSEDTRTSLKLGVVRFCKTKADLEAFFAETQAEWNARRRRAPQAAPLPESFNPAAEAPAPAALNGSAMEDEGGSSADRYAGLPKWKDRHATDSRNPVEFIQRHYGKFENGAWHHAGLTRPDLKSDPQLYAAYATWISRHPADALTFAAGRSGGRPRIEDPVEAIERYRASARASAKRHWEKRKAARAATL